MRLHTVRIALVIAAVGAAQLLPVSTAGAVGTAYSWVGGSVDPHADNHSWTDPLNWQPNGVPGDGDSVSVAAPLPAICAAHVDHVPAVTLAAFSLVEQSNACSVSVSGGAITVLGAFSWPSGTLDAPVTIAAGATASFTGGQGRLKIATADITVAGSATMVGASGAEAVRLVNPHILHVVPGGTLNAVGSNDISFGACCVSPARVVNDGTLQVTGGQLRITAVQFDQRARLVVASGAQVLTTSAPVTAASGATYSGGGSWDIGHGATGRFTGTQAVSAPFRLMLGGESTRPGGTLGGTFTLTGTGGLDWTAGVLEAGMTVAHGFTVHAFGADPPSARRFLTGRDYTTGGAPAVRVVNYGSFVVDQGASVTTSDGAWLTNAANGVLRLAAGTVIRGQSCCVKPDRITNAGGTVSVDAGTGSTVTISTASYQSSGGHTVVGVGKTLQLTTGAPALLSSTTVSGGGRLLIAVPTVVSGTLTLGASTTLALIDRGALNGTATVRGAGAMTWTGGSISGALTVTSRLTVAGTATKSLAGVNGGTTPSTARFAGPTTFTAGTSALPNPVDLGWSKLLLTGASTFAPWVRVTGGTLQNAGVLTINAPAAHLDRTGSAVTVNTGTVLVRSGTLAFSNTYQQSAGRTELSPGTVLATTSSTGRVVLAAGTLSGAGLVKATVANARGTVTPGLSGGTAVGTLRITGGYSQASTSRLILDVSSGTADRLAVDHTAAVAGTVALRTPGTAVPRLGHRATVLTTGTGLSWHVSCAYTTGPGSSSANWATSRTSRVLVVTRTAGAHTHC